MFFHSSQPTPIPEEKCNYLQTLESGETHISLISTFDHGPYLKQLATNRASLWISCSFSEVSKFTNIVLVQSLCEIPTSLKILYISQFQAPTSSPRETAGVLHAGVARGSDLLSIIKVPSCQLMPHEGTFQFQTDLPSIAALLLQNLFQRWGKTSKF